MSWWRLNKREADLERELRSDLELEEEEQREGGKSLEEAWFAARRAFGNALLIKERTHEAWGWARFERLLQDLRYALRQMRRSPGFATTVIGTLALGIGATTAMFTVVDHVLLQPTPYRDAGRLVSVQETNGSDYTWPSPWLDIESWQAQSKTLGEIAFSAKMSGRNFLVQQTTGLEVDAERVSSNLFSALGVHPLLGNGFLPEGSRSATEKNTGNIILSYAVWSEVFGADPAILGKVVKINNDSYTVFGVMPAAFRYPEGSRETPQVWIPIQVGSDDASRNYKAMQYTVLARLSPGATLQSANTEMSLLQKHIAADYTDVGLRKDHSVVRIVAYSDSLVGRDVRSALLALQAASGVLWLIAVMNATNLLLARSVVRQREIAMRGALAAAKAAQTEARSKSKNSAAKAATKSEVTKPAEATRPAPQPAPEPARAASLFDAPAAVPNSDMDEEEEILAEVGEEDEVTEEIDEAA
jgi:hypothetical protein